MSRVDTAIFQNTLNMQHLKTQNSQYLYNEVKRLEIRKR